ncbi:hypothetical protein DMN91_006269 [Ooceraea biroi]|uniref:Centriolar coiled-coil protein of 110 kDa n=2 Tax=Ooceraea biroi TaxID=2015173 RepID=A0A3L8DNU1_OOCBI|nr:uncharacterized protein LOC105284595 [Ooceraea biroi]RLU21892.1 hypothetical protein DMN91_006269 [Ooceraea biroi]
MQQEFYTSCIKIHGIPLLPPLTTDSIKEEMRHYRSLAMKVEERLKSRQLMKCAKDKCVLADITEPVDILRDIKYSSDSDISNYNTTSDNTYNSDSFSKMTIVERVQTRQTTPESRDECNIQSSASDVQPLQFPVCLNNDTVNDVPPISEGIDKNKCINETGTAVANEGLTSSESKPEIPKTLDIVPLTLDKEVDSIQSFTIVPKENENLPKLSRQGSYVLETPSPCLLAHMDTDLVDKEYIPTPTTNASQRMQCNAIVSSKVEWQNERLTAENTKDAVIDKSKHKINANHELVSQHTEANTSIELHQVNESSSIAAEHLTEKHTSESDTQIKHNQISDIDLRQQGLLEKSKEGSSIQVLHSANKSQELMEDTCNSEMQLSCMSGNQYHNDGIEAGKECQDLIVKTKSSTIPEKLLTVYKQIEEMHKKQMMELISRQRKEQSLLEAEFQKQQTILLAEIRKCSFGTPHQADVSNAMSNQLLSGGETRLEDSEAREQLNVNFPSNLRAETPRNSKVSSANHGNAVCPLDYISPKSFHLLKSHASSPLITDVSLTALNFNVMRKVNSCDVTHNNNNNSNDYNSNCESHDRSARKNSTVNRQLFPLDSNTMHVPVLDTSAYLEKHIRAVNIINAYARGYLVRRLMRTERVITLKKTYKEALQCMLKLHVDAPLNLAEVNFLHRLQLQCDAASMNLVELFAQSPTKRMKVIEQDREIKQSRAERPSSSRSYSFATQKTLARKNIKEFESTMTKYQRPTLIIKKNIVRSRCQTWTSNLRDRLVSPNALHQGIRRSTSAGTVRKPWR